MVIVQRDVEKPTPVVDNIDKKFYQIVEPGKSEKQASYIRGVNL